MSKQSNFANIYGQVTDVMIKRSSFTLKPGMNGFWIRCISNSGAMVVTVPVGLQEGFSCVLFNETANTLTVGGFNVGLASVDGLLSIAAPYGIGGLFCYTPNYFSLSGNLV